MWTPINGLRVHARVSMHPDAGDVRPVILVHGAGVSGRYLVPTGARLAPHCPVYIPDLPGFGRSDDPGRVLDTSELAASLAAWMDAVRVDRASLLANSYGCQIAAQLAVDDRRRVDRLVLQGPTVDPAARRWRTQVGRWLRNSPNEPLSQLPLVISDYRDAGVGRVLATLGQSFRHELEALLPLVRAPTLVVVGDRDPIVPMAWAEEVARLLPRGRLVVVPGGHTLNFSRPEDLLRVSLPFLLSDQESAGQIGRPDRHGAPR